METAHKAYNISVCSLLNKVEPMCISRTFLRESVEKLSLAGCKLIHVWYFSQTRETSLANKLREGMVYERQPACTMPLKQQTLEVITEVFPLLGLLEKTMSALSDSQVPKVCHTKNISWLSHHFMPGVGNFYNWFPLLFRWCCFYFPFVSWDIFVNGPRW